MLQIILPWVHAVKIFLQEKRMLKYLVDNPYKKDSTYEDWMSEGFSSYGCCGILWNLTLLLQLNFVTCIRRFGTL